MNSVGKENYDPDGPCDPPGAIQSRAQLLVSRLDGIEPLMGAGGLPVDLATLLQR